MPLSPQIKGYSFALLATVAGSTVYIFSKTALDLVSLAQFGVYWFAMAIGWNSLFALSSKKTRHFNKISKNSIKVLFLLGIIEIVATASFFASISVALNPAIPSFLKNMEYIFVTLMGVILLHEKFSRIEILAVFLTISGALVISYQNGSTIEAFLTGSSGYMLLATIFYGIRTIIVKKNIEVITPTMIAINRSIFLFVFAVAMLLIYKQGLSIPTYALIMILLGSFTGPFLTSLSQYNALKYIEASKSAIIQSTTAMFVLITAYLVFGRFPLPYQIIGGVLTIAGPMLLMLGRNYPFSRRS
ncbi:MAG TPA: DMT family transporter [Bacteroidales bacterium]